MNSFVATTSGPAVGRELAHPSPRFAARPLAPTGSDQLALLGHDTKPAPLRPAPSEPNRPTPDSGPVNCCLLLPGGRPEASVRGLTLEQFASAGMVVEVFSSLLGDRVVLASDNATVREEERVVYRAAELRALAGLGADGLRVVHRVKKAIQSRVEGVEVRVENAQERLVAACP